MIIWLVGLSGSGKTTIGQLLYDKLKAKNHSTIFIDGDKIRAVFSHDQDAIDYTLAGRRKSSQRLHALCHWLDQEGIDVVCCSISMFQDIKDRNRELFSRYFEVFIDVPLATLIERDNKGLYQAALSGQKKAVVGVDIPYHARTYIDLTINNNYKANSINGYVEQIMKICGGGV